MECVTCLHEFSHRMNFPGKTGLPHQTAERSAVGPLRPQLQLSAVFARRSDPIRGNPSLKNVKTISVLAKGLGAALDSVPRGALLGRRAATSSDLLSLIRSNSD